MEQRHRHWRYETVRAAFGYLQYLGNDYPLSDHALGSTASRSFGPRTFERTRFEPGLEDVALATRSQEDGITVARTDCGADVFGLACFLRDEPSICRTY